LLILLFFFFFPPNLDTSNSLTSLVGLSKPATLFFSIISS
jgi:hypothetical protein